MFSIWYLLFTIYFFVKSYCLIIFSFFTQLKSYQGNIRSEPTLRSWHSSSYFSRANTFYWTFSSSIVESLAFSELYSIIVFPLYLKHGKDIFVNNKQVVYNLPSLILFYNYTTSQMKLSKKVWLALLVWGGNNSNWVAKRSFTRLYYDAKYTTGLLQLSLNTKASVKTAFNEWSGGSYTYNPILHLYHQSLSLRRNLKTNLIKSINFGWVFTSNFFHARDAINSFIQNHKLSEWPIRHFVSDNAKFESSDTLEGIKLYFLRKNKVFNKGRYSRNRQYYRTGVYWCLYINIIAIVGMYLWFYKLTFNFGYLWFVLFVSIFSFFFSRIVKYNLFQPNILCVSIFTDLLWFSNLIYLILSSVGKLFDYLSRTSAVRFLLLYSRWLYSFSLFFSFNIVFYFFKLKLSKFNSSFIWEYSLIRFILK